MTRGDDAAIDARVAEMKAAAAEYELREARASARLDSLRAASRRSAAYADSVTGIAPKDSAAKVAAVMAANDITLPQVAAFLATYGFDVINRAEFREWTWTPAPAGTNPIAYYVANFRVATGSNSLRVYLPQTAGPYWIRVKAYDGQGNSGPWSMTSTSAAGDLLPGVVE